MKSLLTLLFTVTATLAVAALSPGETAPDFHLTDTDGQKHHLQTYLDDGKIVVLEWFNPDCPYVKKHHEANHTMKNLAAEYADDGVVWMAINSGAEGKQGAGLERNRKAIEEYAIAYPVLLDMNGKVGKRYGATNTPHMFVIGTDGEIAYAGAIDSDNDARELGETNYVAEALAALTSGAKVEKTETKAYGCSVKY
jgi:peroxiredoxin